MWVRDKEERVVRCVWAFECVSLTCFYNRTSPFWQKKKKFLVIVVFIKQGLTMTKLPTSRLGQLWRVFLQCFLQSWRNSLPSLLPAMLAEAAAGDGELSIMRFSGSRPKSSCQFIWTKNMWCAVTHLMQIMSQYLTTKTNKVNQVQVVHRCGNGNCHWCRYASLHPHWPLGGAWASLAAPVKVCINLAWCGFLERFLKGHGHYFRASVALLIGFLS